MNVAEYRRAMAELFALDVPGRRRQPVLDLAGWHRTVEERS